LFGKKKNSINFKRRNLQLKQVASTDNKKNYLQQLKFIWRQQKYSNSFKVIILIGGLIEQQ